MFKVVFCNGFRDNARKSKRRDTPHADDEDVHEQVAETGWGLDAELKETWTGVLSPLYADVSSGSFHGRRHLGQTWFSHRLSRAAGWLCSDFGHRIDRLFVCVSGLKPLFLTPQLAHISTRVVPVWAVDATRWWNSRWASVFRVLEIIPERTSADRTAEGGHSCHSSELEADLSKSSEEGWGWGWGWGGVADAGLTFHTAFMHWTLWRCRRRLLSSPPLLSGSGGLSPNLLF